MPLYEFVCRDCNCEQELLVREAERPVCETCGSDRLLKLLSVPAAHSAGSTAAGKGDMPSGPCGASCGCFPQ